MLWSQKVNVNKEKLYFLNLHFINTAIMKNNSHFYIEDYSPSRRPSNSSMFKWLRMRFTAKTTFYLLFTWQVC